MVLLGVNWQITASHLSQGVLSIKSSCFLYFALSPLSVGGRGVCVYTGHKYLQITAVFCKV